MIVMTIIALIAGLSYPSISSGLESLRLRAASDAIVALLNAAVDRADRSQQLVEVVISPKDNAVTARTADERFRRRIDVPEPVRILAVQPVLALPNTHPDDVRRFFIYPGGTVPRIGIEIGNGNGRRRLVRVDPISGFPRSEVLEQQ
jgi:type II secretory pathway pseudopilin PulG